jgi:hypothetical protein
MSEILRDILYIIISGCGVAVTKYIVDLVNKKVNEAQVNTEIKEYEKLNKYVDMAQDAIEKAVLTTAQTYVDSLKNSNGFTKEAQEEAKNKAIEIAKQMITEESKEAIIILYGDFNVYLDSTLESLVKQNKVITQK